MIFYLFRTHFSKTTLFHILAYDDYIYNNEKQFCSNAVRNGKEKINNLTDVFLQIFGNIYIYYSIKFFFLTN